MGGTHSLNFFKTIYICTSKSLKIVSIISFLVHNNHLNLCGQVENFKWILCNCKTGVKLGYLRFLVYKIFVAIFSWFDWELQLFVWHKIFSNIWHSKVVYSNFILVFWIYGLEILMGLKLNQANLILLLFYFHFLIDIFATWLFQFIYFNDYCFDRFFSLRYLFAM